MMTPQFRQQLEACRKLRIPTPPKDLLLLLLPRFLPPSLPLPPSPLLWCLQSRTLSLRHSRDPTTCLATAVEAQVRTTQRERRAVPRQGLLQLPAATFRRRSSGKATNRLDSSRLEISTAAATRQMQCSHTPATPPPVLLHHHHHRLRLRLRLLPFLRAKRRGHEAPRPELVFVQQHLPRLQRLPVVFRFRNDEHQQQVLTNRGSQRSRRSGDHKICRRPDVVIDDVGSVTVGWGAWPRCLCSRLLRFGRSSERASERGGKA